MFREESCSHPYHIKDYPYGNNHVLGQKITILLGMMEKDNVISVLFFECYFCQFEYSRHWGGWPTLGLLTVALVSIILYLFETTFTKKLLFRIFLHVEKNGNISYRIGPYLKNFLIILLTALPAEVPPSLTISPG